ncbi:MAG: cobamide remodeling phosphodiesterase CbiR [Pseudomonadota bacterium]
MGTTSFIYPDHYARNVQLLGPFFDEIELLFFESRFEDSLPSRKVVQELKDLSQQHGVSYNIHLPVDVSLGDDSMTKRMHAVDTINRFIDRTQPLSPSTSTLHLVKPESIQNKTDIRNWQDRLYWSLEKVAGKEFNGKNLSIENLFYPMDLIEPVIREFHLSVCIDTGHLILSDQDMEKTFETWKGAISIVHLHGAAGGKDHLCLDQLTSGQMKQVISKLREFTGTVSLEVFSFSKLYNSMAIFEKMWDNRRITNINR